MQGGGHDETAKKGGSFIVRCAAGCISILQVDVAALWRAGVIHQLE